MTWADAFARVKTAATSHLSDSATWTHGGTDTAITGFYDDGFGSELDRRASPSSPKFVVFTADVDGIAIGDQLTVNSVVHDIVPPIDTDEVLGETTLHLRVTA